MENEILKCLKSRRSIRGFKDTPVPEELVKAITEAGTYAASGHGKQSAQIVAVSNPETIAELRQMNAAIMGFDGDPYYYAPLILLVFADSNAATWIEDGCCVTCNMMIAAHSVGLGSCWINRERQMFDSAQGRALMRKWGMADSMRGISALAIGYPAVPAPEPKPRKADYCIYVK